jgi:hypothetical protein
MKMQALTLVILLLGAAGIARADQDYNHRVNRDWHERLHSRESILQAPEIDPASMVVALTLLAGGLAVLRGRRAQ